jgi:hypothetical protein
VDASGGTAGTDSGASGSAGVAGTGGAGAVFGSAVHFDHGCATQSSADARTLFSGVAFTLEFWLRLDDSSEMWQSVIYRGGNSSPGAAGWTLEMSAVGNGNQVLQLCGSNGSDKWACVSSIDELIPGNRYHVAIVRIPSGQDCPGVGIGGCARFYVARGEGAIRLHTENVKPFGVDWQTAEPLRLAAWGPTCSAYHLHADIDELRIWSRALGRDELDAAMGRDVACASTGLVAYYKFDEPSGTALVNCAQQGSGTLTLEGTFNRLNSPFDD